MHANNPSSHFQVNKFMGWFYIIASVLFLGSSLSRIIEERDSETWPSTYGTVINSEIYQPARSKRWCFKLHYRYVVDNQVFSSKRLSTSVLSDQTCSRDKDLTAARVERLHPGARIKIRYRQSKPRRAIVYRDDLHGLYLFLAFGGASLLGGIISLRKAGSIAQAHARDSKPPVT
jgi:hypothetical protein